MIEDKTDQTGTIKGSITSSKHEVSNKDLIETLKTKYGPKNLQPSSSYIAAKKGKNVFSKPKSFDYLGRDKRNLSKISKLRKENFVKKYSEGVGFSKVREAKGHTGQMSFYNNFKFKDRRYVKNIF